MFFQKFQKLTLGCFSKVLLEKNMRPDGEQKIVAVPNLEEHVTSSRTNV